MNLRTLPFIFIAIFGLLVVSCDNETVEPTHSEFMTHAAESISFTEAVLKGELFIHDDEVFECGFIWSKTPNPTTTTGEKKYFGPQTENISLIFNAVGLSLNTTYYFKTFIITSRGIHYGEELSFQTLPEVEWSDPNDFPGEARMGGVSIVIEGKAYVGLGHGRDALGNFQFYRDFWELDIASNTWTKRKDYPGFGWTGGVAFVVNKKGYVGTGVGPGDTSHGADFWEYDPSADTWTRKADFGGGGVSFATAFSLNGKGYVGTGLDFGTDEFSKKFYEYDPLTDVWTRKADFPGFAIDQAVAFSIGDLGYIGMGLRHESWLGHTKQLWAYMPETDTWTQKKDCPSTSELTESIAFVMNGKAYIGLGWGGDNTIWKYDPETNEWTADGQVVKNRIGAVAIPLGNKVSIGVGGSAGGFYKDFEEYIPQ